MSLKKILGEGSYKALNEKLREGLAERKMAEMMRKQEAERKASERSQRQLQRESLREEALKFLKEILQDQTFRDYLEIEGSLKVYGTGLWKGVVLSKKGIFYKDGLNSYLDFNDGHSKVEVDCGMGGSKIEDYGLEDFVGNIQEFKGEVEKNVRKILKKYLQRK